MKTYKYWAKISFILTFKLKSMILFEVLYPQMHFWTYYKSKKIIECLPSHQKYTLKNRIFSFFIISLLSGFVLREIILISHSLQCSLIYKCVHCQVYDQFTICWKWAFPEENCISFHSLFMSKYKKLVDFLIS